MFRFKQDNIFRLMPLSNPYANGINMWHGMCVINYWNVCFDLWTCVCSVCFDFGHVLEWNEVVIKKFLYNQLFQPLFNCINFQQAYTCHPRPIGIGPVGVIFWQLKKKFLPNFLRWESESIHTLRCFCVSL